LKVAVNGKEEIIDQEISLIDFLDSKGLELERLVIEYNQQVIQKKEWDKIILKDGDVLEILRFVGGG
jgi:sulfur carrier protein